MGNVPTAASSASKLQDHAFIRQEAEGRNVMVHKATNRQVLTIEHTFPCEEMMNDYVRKNKATMSLQHQFYLNAHDYEILSQVNLCSKQYKIIQYFQHQRHTLMSETEGRMQTQRQYTNKEIMSILCSVVLAMSYISKLELLHYTLNPDDIIIDENGVCKVKASGLSTHQFDFNADKTFYYAPETLKIFKMQTATNTLTNKSAVFTLGMTILSMVHLSQLHHVYNFHNYSINMEEIGQLVKVIKDEDLRIILGKMLKYHSYQRITFTEMEEMLFEIIHQSQMRGQKSLVCLQEQQQISALEDSIVRIRQSRRRQVQPTFEYHQHYQKQDDTLPLHFFSQAVEALPADQEDMPVFDYDYLPRTEEDPVVLDEDDKAKDEQTFQRRQFLESSRSQVPMNDVMSYSEINRRQPLMENSDFSNYSQHEPRICQPNQSSLQMLCIKGKQGDFMSSEKKTVRDGQSEYVTQFFKQGKYEGYKVGRYRHGFGTFYYNDGGKYCGQWVKNRMQGRGILYYGNGKLAYEGQWYQDQLSGYGVLYNEKIEQLQHEFDFSHLEQLTNQWIKYEGYFESDMKHGQGTLFMTNGEYFRGTFQNDLPNGQGQFKNVRGEVNRGFWLMGALNQLS